MFNYANILYTVFDLELMDYTMHIQFSMAVYAYVSGSCKKGRMCLYVHNNCEFIKYLGTASCRTVLLALDLFW